MTLKKILACRETNYTIFNRYYNILSVKYIVGTFDILFESLNIKIMMNFTFFNF